MAVQPEVVKNRIQELITEMNSRTGVNDTNLSDAINSLKEGWSDIPGEHFYINGALKAYAVQAGASVKAGDFVEFVREWGTGGLVAKVSTDVVAVALDDHRVLFIYTDSTLAGYARVVSIDGTDIGSPVKIYTTVSNSGGYVSAAAMAPDRVLVAYRSGTNTGYVLALKVDGVNVTKSGTCSIAHGGPYSLTRLKNSEALLAYPGSAVKITHAYNGATPSAGTAATFDSSVTDKIKAVTLREDQALIVYGSSSYCKAIAVNTSTNPVTFGSSAVVESSQAPTYLAATAMSPREVLVLCNVSTGHAKVYQLVVSGTTISTSDTEYLHGGQSGRWLYVAPLTPSKALAIGNFNDGTKVETRAMVVTVGGTAVTVGTAAVIHSAANWDAASTYACLITLSESSALFAYSMSSQTGYRSLTIDGTTVTVVASDVYSRTTVKKADSNSDIVGIAKTSGTAGTTVQVYRVKN